MNSRKREQLLASHVKELFSFTGAHLESLNAVAMLKVARKFPHNGIHLDLQALPPRVAMVIHNSTGISQT
ncbi:hypothetical protein PspLS_08400 [Pyricularia sp. CBS 133598]|nr:hypothetical protein PspLS_08400 [Pyricularia sp. CBS 133598]